MGQRITVFRGGTVITADRRRPRATAVAVQGETVVALDDAALEHVDDADDVVDLTGRTLLPGFRDGHIHPLWGGTETLDAPVVEATDLDDILDRVRRHAQEHPDVEWVLGHGYPPEVLPNGNATAAQLDAVIRDRPVALWASDHHTMWVNTRALELAGIDRDTPDPPQGALGRDEGGTPTGMLHEAAMDLVTRLVPVRTQEDKATGLRRALDEMAACGIVWAQEAALAPDDVDVYLAVEAAGDLTADVNIALRAEPPTWRDLRPAFREACQRAAAAEQRTGPGRVTARTVKIFADGVIEAGTGALLEPYTDAPHSCGIANWERDELVEAACAFDADRFQLHIHAIGDAGVRLALDAVEEVTRRNGVRDRRPVIAHTQLIHPDDLERFVALGVVANFEPLWAQQSLVMTDLTEPRLGPERSARQYQIATLLQLGATVSFGSDWPVSSMVPLEGISTALTRETEDGQPPGGWTPHERISLDEAVGAYTLGTAFQGFDDDAGRIVEGARADLCVVDADLEALSAAKMGSAAVSSAWLRGRKVDRG